jgi:hypothetical protein
MMASHDDDDDDDAQQWERLVDCWQQRLLPPRAQQPEAAAAAAPPPQLLPPPPAAPAPAAAPPQRYSYRNPQTGGVAGPFAVSAFAGWVASGAISAAEADALRVWLQGAPEDSSVPLRQVLAAAAEGGSGAA